MSDGLEQLATAVGLSPRYHDGLGREHHTPDDALLALLRARGLAIERPDQAREVLAEHRATRLRRLVDPVLVGWDGSGPPAHLRTAAPPRSGVAARLELAGGEVRDWTVEPAETAGEPGSDGRHQVLVPLPGDLPAGRHRLEVDTPDGVASATVLIAPTRVHPGPIGEHAFAWGAFLPLHAAWSAGSGGLGEVTDLGILASWVDEHGGRAVATLPLLAGFWDHPVEPSPYRPVSRRFWNEAHLDLGCGVGAGDRPDGQRPEARVDATHRGLAGGGLVDHGAVWEAKRDRLDALVRDLDPASGAALEAWLAEHPEVERYARFRAVGERRGRDWQRWPARLRQGRIYPSDADPGVIRRHQLAQWLMHRQLVGLSGDLARRDQVLYLDLPLGTHPDGYDTWADQALHARGVTVGAPPDGFFPTGQNWGFAPVLPDAGDRDGWAHLSACLDHHLEVAGLLRIDHALGLYRLFWIPEGGEPADGAYVSYPADQLVAVLSAASHRWAAGLTGEDLGTVPAELTHLLAHHGIAGMTVAEFETTDDPRRPLRLPRPGSIAFLSTHDLPTLSGWWQERDIDTRCELGVLDPEAAEAARCDRSRSRGALRRLADLDPEMDAPGPPPRAVLDATLSTLGGSEARLVMVNVEDLWLEEAPQNVPGTAGGANWRRRAAHPVEAIDAVPGVAASVEALAAARRLRTARPLPEWMTEDECYLFNEGTFLRLPDRLGAHPRRLQGVAGVQFSVWAPDAQRVTVTGSFDDWAGDGHSLEVVGATGIWTGFVPGAAEGDLYKYRVTSRYGGYRVDKADPVAFRAEVPPRTASVVWAGEHRWEDDAWMAERGSRQRPDRPMTIYEVHLGSWRRVPEEGDRWLTYRELAPLLADHCTDLGFTHVELMPVMEHPLYASWGYQVTGFFAPTSRYGRPEDLMAFVDHLHQRGIGVILDWVPAHFPSDEHALGYFDGTHLYEHADPRQRVHPDWQSLIFNFGRREVQNFLVASALAWLERFHIDGLRLDAVASMLYLDYSRREGEWVPNPSGGRENLDAIAFLRRLNREVYARFPDVVTMAEESTAWPAVSAPVHDGGLGFGAKWDMGWMNDTLRYFRREPVHRRWHHDELTFRSMYAASEHFVLPLSHDEVVHGKGSLLGAMPGDDWQRFATLRLLYGYQYTVPGKPLLFMGAELAPWEEWDHDRSLPWHLLEHAPHRGIRDWLRHLNHLVAEVPALHEVDRDPSGFAWVDADDRERSLYSWLRFDLHGGPALVVLNATPVPRPDVTLGVPTGGAWTSVANSDAPEFGGSGYPVPAVVHTVPTPEERFPHALTLAVPPLALLVLHPVR